MKRIVYREWRLQPERYWGLLAILGAVAAIAGLGMQGITDTIFFRPEVQLTGWFCLASLAVSRAQAGTDG